MTPWTRLPFSFEPGPLRADLAAIPDSAWVPHFNRNDYEGHWSSLSLRSLSGRANDIQPRGDASDFKDTPLAGECRHFKRVIDALHFPKKSVRLLRLHAHSRVNEHRDADLKLADGEIRIHVPIRTHDRVEFVVANRQLVLNEGEAWYIDFTQPHRIDNAGDSDRIHLVIDGNANEWALNLIRRGVEEMVTQTLEPPGMRNFRQFCSRVFEDPRLQATLLEVRDRQQFFDAVLTAAAALGLSFHRVELDSVYRQNQLGWLEQAIDL
ncbi:MAG TPA: aspartyl/asparaginyl beta-hydroxylase domain-containing protein [Steroidobacteraceae bacterium]